VPLHDDRPLPLCHHHVLHHHLPRGRFRHLLLLQVLTLFFFFSFFSTQQTNKNPTNENSTNKKTQPLPNRYYSTWAPVLPVTALYVLGPRKSIPYVLAGLFLLLGSHFFSRRPEDLEPFVSEPNHRLEFLVLAYLIQFLPILYLLALDEEAKFYHTLLLKSLKDLEEKSKAKTTFISRMSHELRTPLQGLLSSVALLKETKMNEEQRTFTGLIDSCGELLLNIMEKILDITRIESDRFETQMQPFSLLDLVPTLLESVVGMASAKGLDLYVRFDLKAQTYVVNGDQKLLGGILTNVRTFLGPSHQFHYQSINSRPRSHNNTKSLAFTR